MVKLVVSEMGDGKTKRIISLANETSEKSVGDIVFLDYDKGHMYDLKHNIRFVNMSEFPVATSDEFVGFICGIISNNYDINYIYIDGYFKVIDGSSEDLRIFVSKLEEIGKRYDINFVVTASSEEIPEGLNIDTI